MYKIGVELATLVLSLVVVGATGLIALLVMVWFVVIRDAGNLYIKVSGSPVEDAWLDRSYDQMEYKMLEGMMDARRPGGRVLNDEK